MNKVAYLLGSVNRGGAETLLLDVFRNASRLQLPAIGIYRKSGVLETDFLNSGTPMFYLPVPKNIFRYLFHLRKLLKHQNVKVVHAQQPLDALFALLCCFGSDVKIYLTFHGYDFRTSFLGMLINKYVILRTHKNIFVSHSQKDYFSSKFNLDPAKQVVVYNGVSMDKFDRAAIDVKTSIRNELNLTNDSLLYATVGNFVQARDQMTICKFLKLLKVHEPNFHFIFIGKKSDQFPQLYDDCLQFCNENGLAENVRFLGSRDDVPAILKELDAFIYSTHHDTFGIAVVEAIATGIPVFANDWEAIAEITEQGKFATLYKSQDEKDLLREFVVFLHNRPLFLDNAAKSASAIRNKFSIERHIEELIKCYHQ